jgi:uncharacterized sulfatase
MLRALLTIAATWLVIAPFAADVPVLGGGDKTPPNIVVFIADDHGYLDTAFADPKQFRTPAMARLAHDGITLTHVFAASPSCAPSRAALLTGLMPTRNGAMLNHQPPRADAKKLPAYFQPLGYEVVAIGKVAHYKQGRDYGFDFTSHDTFHDDECVAAAVDFLHKRRSDKPLCLLVGTNWPHVPWPKVSADTDAGQTASFTPPPTHVDTPATRRWRARYAAAVERCDRDLGLIYDAAYQRLGDNTLFIEFSDHGAQWPFGKWNLYDAGTRTPMLAVWPGVIQPGSHSNALVSLVDLLPTLVEAAGGTPPPNIDGRSFVALLKNRSGDFRDAIFTTHSGDGTMNEYPMRAVRTRRWKYIRNLNPAAEYHTHIDLAKAVDGSEYWNSWVALAETDPAAKRIVERYLHRPAEDLYDLDADPNELRNLAAEPRHSSTLKDLRTRLDSWMRNQGDEGLATESRAAESLPNPLLQSPAAAAK